MELKNKVACDAPSSSGIYVIMLNIVSLYNIWVFDTSCGSNIWFDMQDQGTVESSQRESPTFGSVMVQELQLLPLGLML